MEYDAAHKTSSITSTSSYDPAHKTSSVTSTSSYDPAHKTSSVASTNSNLSIWDPLPSLYTGRADSVSSVYELDDLQEPFEEGFNNNYQDCLSLSPYEKEAVVVPAASTTDESSINDFLNSFFKQEEDSIVKKEQVVNHEVPSSTLLCHGNRKRPYHEEEDTTTNNNKNRELLSEDQKRANHIASEQKRRNTIRGGFKELTEIIPTLKNINNSKSTILFKSVDYIKQLDKRNKSLKERLALLQARVQQKAQKKLLQQQQQQQLPPNAVAALLVHKNQQKQLELLQEQLRVQQALLTKHNIQSTHTPLYPPASDSSVGYHSISIPAMDDTPVHSTTTSPTLPHASLPPPVNNNHQHHSHHSIYQHNNYSTPAALVMPASQDEWQHASFAPSFTIPADDEICNSIRRERLLSSGKLNHLRKQSIDPHYM